MLTVVHFVSADPPQIIVRPRDQTLLVGGTAALYCAAQGSPTPTLTWKKNNKKLSSTQSRYAVEANGGVLRIEPVRPRDNATYECVAENNSGDAVSAEATITVIERKYTHDLH